MLFRWAKDRLRYLKRLRETSLRYPISVLNYMVTDNHVHLLLRAERPACVADAMQYLSGCAAQDYNRRKKREGAFWRGRYRPTLVESGRHLTRCFFYVELNMVRAGLVRHPEEWVGGRSASIRANGNATESSTAPPCSTALSAPIPPASGIGIWRRFGSSVQPGTMSGNRGGRGRRPWGRRTGSGRWPAVSPPPATR